MRAMIRRGVFPLLLVLLFAACNGGGEEAQPTPSRAVAQPSPMAEPTPTATPTPTPEPAVQRIAYIGTDGNIWIMNADGSGQQKLFEIETEPGDSVRNLRWSPDGSKLAVRKRGSESGPGSEGVIYIVSAGGEALLEVPDVVGFLAWSPDGTRIAFVSSPGGPAGEIYFMNADGSGLTRLSDGPASYIDWSPDGRWLAFFAVIRELDFFTEVIGMLADLQTTEVEPIDPGEQLIDEYATSPPIFSPTDASLLAYGSRLFDLNTGQERSLPERAVSWSPDGQRLLLLECGSAPVSNAQVYDVQKGSSVLEFNISLRGIGAPCWAVMRGQTGWSPDSRFLASYDVPTSTDALGVLRLRDIDTGDQKTVSMDFPTSLQFSPDSRLLLFYSADGIWVLGSDGTNLTLLAEGSRAAWQPQP